MSAILRKLRSYTPVTLTAALFLRCNKGVNQVFNVVAGVSDGLWLGVMNDAVLHRIDEVHYQGQTYYFRPDYNVRGLLSWERDAVDRYFADVKRVVVTAAGGGRETYTLLGEGYDVVGFECNEQMGPAGNDLLRDAGTSTSGAGPSGWSSCARPAPTSPKVHLSWCRSSPGTGTRSTSGWWRPWPTPFAGSGETNRSR